ncbi:Dabb family protein [Phytohabitans suffuscus]|uniref:Stress-response A/B barrel domain-containing protein n=1 Tax=Phytohabitans suffuscus TaxID=624315 RepID=A0A6F8YYR1_9ACTN|nr:Dabb family protein [Phytohabitans suffuscus]BCB91320.1 hypothetical protein Psuf_086330 [Phytohabitans suffuscus]
MIDHVIMFRAEGLPPETERTLMARLGELATIPGVVGFALGKNFGERSRGFDYCLRVTLRDRAALEEYEEHPVHLAVRAYNRSVTTEHICVDFEWTPSTVEGGAR